MILICIAFSDVCNEDRELVVSVFDQGNLLPNGDDRFLGLVKLKPSLVPKKTTDQWCRLLPRTEDEKVTGEIRLQTEYTSVGPVSTLEILRPFSFLLTCRKGQIDSRIIPDRTFAWPRLIRQSVSGHQTGHEAHVCHESSLEAAPYFAERSCSHPV